MAQRIRVVLLVLREEQDGAHIYTDSRGVVRVTLPIRGCPGAFTLASAADLESACRKALLSRARAEEVRMKDRNAVLIL